MSQPYHTIPYHTRAQPYSIANVNQNYISFVIKTNDKPLELWLSFRRLLYLSIKAKYKRNYINDCISCLTLPDEILFNNQIVCFWKQKKLLQIKTQILSKFVFNLFTL